jgi:hypothetical protein
LYGIIACLDKRNVNRLSMSVWQPAIACTA